MLYLGVSSSNWYLRLASLKRMAFLFASFDRDTYERIIPTHLADLKSFSTHILQCLKEGGFTVNVTGRKFGAVAFDEAQEMCINKDMKGTVTHPTHACLQKTSLFFNCRIKAFKYLNQCIISALLMTRLTHKIGRKIFRQWCGLMDSGKLVSVQHDN